MRVCVSVVGLMAAFALAAGQTVEFPVGYYFYEEIAQRMSVGGRRVACAPELSDLVALLRLKPREWRQARQILENTLEVRFREIGGNRWVIERPPALVKQEQRLRRSLARRRGLNPPESSAATADVESRSAHRAGTRRSVRARLASGLLPDHPRAGAALSAAAGGSNRSVARGVAGRTDAGVARDQAL